MRKVPHQTEVETGSPGIHITTADPVTTPSALHHHQLYFFVHRMKNSSSEDVVGVPLGAGDDFNIALLLEAAGLDGVCKVTPLSGGLINFVYRAENHFGKSVIIKHFKDQMASNPEVSIDKERYFIEKSALHHCQALKREGLLEAINVQVPELLYFDDSICCLILEDCGKDIISLFEYLRLPNAETEESTKHVVLEIDAFLTVLSNSSSLSSPSSSNIFGESADSKDGDSRGIQVESNRWKNSFFCRGTNLMIEEYVYKLFEHCVADLAALQPFIPLVRKAHMNLREFNEQTQESHSVFHQIVEKEGLRLSFGDLWPSSIYFRTSSCDSTAVSSPLISPVALQVLVSPVIILDWEFCGYDHPLTDYCHLLAYIVLMQHDATYNQGKVAQMIDTLMECISNKITQNPSLSVSLDNISVLLCNAAIILEEDRFQFTEGKEAAAVSFAKFINNFISIFPISPSDFESTA